MINLFPLLLWILSSVSPKLCSKPNFDLQLGYDAFKIYNISTLTLEEEIDRTNRASFREYSQGGFVLLRLPVIGEYFPGQRVSGISGKVSYHDQINSFGRETAKILTGSEISEENEKRNPMLDIEVGFGPLHGLINPQTLLLEGKAANFVWDLGGYYQSLNTILEAISGQKRDFFRKEIGGKVKLGNSFPFSSEKVTRASQFFPAGFFEVGFVGGVGGREEKTNLVSYNGVHGEISSYLEVYLDFLSKTTKQTRRGVSWNEFRKWGGLQLKLQGGREFYSSEVGKTSWIFDFSASSTFNLGMLQYKDEKSIQTRLGPKIDAFYNSDGWDWSVGAYFSLSN